MRLLMRLFLRWLMNEYSPQLDFPVPHPGQKKF